MTCMMIWTIGVKIKDVAMKSIHSKRNVASPTLLGESAGSTQTNHASSRRIALLRRKEIDRRVRELYCAVMVLSAK